MPRKKETKCQVKWLKGYDKILTYLTGGLSIKVGDLVELPHPFESGETVFGTVVGMGSSYDGECRSVIRVVDRAEKPVSR